MQWLTARLESDDVSWLQMDKPLPQRRTGHFQALAKLDGEISAEQPSRELPVPSEVPAIHSDLAATDVAVATP